MRARLVLAAIAAWLAGAPMAAWSAPAPAPGAAMPKPMKAWLFRDPGFTGPVLLIDATTMFLETPWPVRSIRIAGDGKWQMCSDSLFEGRCVMVIADIADLRAKERWNEAAGSLRAICATTGSAS